MCRTLSLLRQGPAIQHKHHLPELQALRGLAALVVVLAHSLMVYQVPPKWGIAIGSVLNSHASVILFFVLSGYVLSGSLLRTSLDFRAALIFYVRRLFRIYPAVWCSCVFAAVVILTVGEFPVIPPASDWFLSYMRPEEFSTSNVVLSFLALKSYLIVPIWTIATEIVGSLMLPLLLAIVLKFPRLLLPILAVLGVAAYLLAEAPHRLDTLSHMVDFALGMTITLHNPIARLTKRTVRVVSLLAVAGLIFSRAGWFFLLTGRLQDLQFTSRDPVPALAEAVCSALLIAAVVSGKSSIPGLDSRPIVRLGDASYSLYLIHFPVLAALARLAPDFDTAGWHTGPMAALFLASSTIIISIPLSTLLYRQVELRGLNFGKLLMAWALPKPKEAKGFKPAENINLR